MLATVGGSSAALCRSAGVPGVIFSQQTSTRRSPPPFWIAEMSSSVSPRTNGVSVAARVTPAARSSSVPAAALPAPPAVPAAQPVPPGDVPAAPPAAVTRARRGAHDGVDAHPAAGAAAARVAAGRRRRRRARRPGRRSGR